MDKSNNVIDELRSETEDSDDGLKIVIDSPQTKRKCKPKQLELSPNDKEIIETMANDLEKTLEEKAAKANLTAYNVKNILKHAVMNEHLLALVRQAEDPQSKVDDLPVYEPKLTRAKAKELFPSQAVASIPWILPPKPSSEVQVLISEELQEDSSGDEYIPGDEEWSEDGVFKIPLAKTKETSEEEANIAKRTRSKLSLSSTPLEVIEEAFIPPDITTDMYDLECDDDDWRDFLKTFTRPLDEVTKDDEDHDPEYNVLADEEIDKVDKEELRADKAVKVTRKELNELMAELFEYADNFTQENQNSNQPLANCEPQLQFTILDNGVVEQSNTTSVHVEIEPVVNEEVQIDETLISDAQANLLQQQMRQHVQMLAQNFILGYEHPEYFEIASKCKEYLLNLKCLSSLKTFSYFFAANLQPALDLLDFWEKKFQSNDEEVQRTKEYVARVYNESKTSMDLGNTYVITFPQLILETISRSNAFLYASLLPKIPFRPPHNNAASKVVTRSENELIALGLEQFIPFLKEDPYHVDKDGKVRMKHVCYYIQKYMMPVRNYHKIYRHVNVCKSLRVDPNPIQYYFQNNKAPVTVHYIINLDQLGILSPRQRKPEELPYQWKQYLFPPSVQPQVSNNLLIPIVPSNITKITKPPIYTNFITKKKRILPKPSNNRRPASRVTTSVKRKVKFENESIRSFSDFKTNTRIASTPINKTKKLEQYFKSPLTSTKTNGFNLLKLKFNSTIFKNLDCDNSSLNTDKMLPSMPSLSTPYKKSPERCITPPAPEELLVSSSVVSTSDQTVISESVTNANEVCEDSKIDTVEESAEKDNIDDINALMVASSTVKPVRKKTLSGAEKKKAKLKKDLSAALSILTPEDEAQAEEKTNRYVQAFYDKLQERLDIHEYHRLIEILNNFEENRDSVVDLYKSVNDILSPKYSDLTDEFLSFLTSSQAKAVGKLVPHIMINNMSLFLRKLEMYFKGQPFQVKKIYRSVTELTDCVDVTMDRVKSTILPLLKGNKLLIDWFLQIFPCETPPQSLLNGTWENIEVGKDSTFNNKEDVYETIIVPEVEDPYGGPNCICSCHNVEDQAFKSRSRHCIPCGTKGRVYVHTGKGLKPAKITFDDNNIEHYKRLGYQSSVHHHKRRSEVSPSKHLVSPNKDTQDDIRMSNESEDDVDCAKKKQQRLSKIPRKRRPKVKRDKKVLDRQKVASVGASKSKVVKRESADTTDKKLDVPDIDIKDPCLNDTKPIIEEVMEWDCNTSIESTELKLSPEPSAESESGETSQDNINTDSDCSAENLTSPIHLHNENSNSNNCEEISWTKEEDKIILETFRRDGDKEETFQQIANSLENRSVTNVKSRFRTLLNIIQQMAAKKVL
ncbi:yy1 associated protein-related [Holotrichia oblita]|uniref:Yy1 associated protein-related n=2 Tax=Holotrichia oblita TaxID=644536 RepID=A0ACB9TP30_HOLOL|nr:yy1 associated protein-related [Holotrichia oblita]